LESPPKKQLRIEDVEEEKEEFRVEEEEGLATDKSSLQTSE